jgi:hypothetical protein
MMLFLQAVLRPRCPLAMITLPMGRWGVSIEGDYVRTKTKVRTKVEKQIAITFPGRGRHCSPIVNRDVKFHTRYRTQPLRKCQMRSLLDAMVARLCTCMTMFYLLIHRRFRSWHRNSWCCFTMALWLSRLRCTILCILSQHNVV